MPIERVYAEQIEKLVCIALNCKPCDYGGFVDADLYEYHPFEAAVLCCGLLYKPQFDSAIADFCGRWRMAFDFPKDYPDMTIDQYVNEFGALLTRLVS